MKKSRNSKFDALHYLQLSLHQSLISGRTKILIAILLFSFNSACSEILTGKPENLIYLVASYEDSLYIVENYEKHEYQISMRDGIKLFTAVYSPKDTSQKYPILFFRTPYSVAPYGEDQYKERLTSSILFLKEKFIFVFQDVRGKFMSEGEFVNMRPHIDNKKNKHCTVFRG